jgi:hypothetical protein
MSFLLTGKLDLIDAILNINDSKSFGITLLKIGRFGLLSVNFTNDFFVVSDEIILLLIAGTIVTKLVTNSKATSDIFINLLFIFSIFQKYK